MTNKLPLPSGYFSCPELKDEDIQRCTEMGEVMAIDLIRHSRLNSGPIRWVLDTSENELQIYSGEDTTAPPGIVSFCAVTQVKASLNEVAALFRTETTEEYKAYCKRFVKGVHDSAMLHTLAKPTTEFPHHCISIKWVAFDLMKGFKQRDCVFLDTQLDFDVQGRRGWVRCSKSIEISSCPDLEAPLNLVRGSFYRSGFVFMETSVPGVLQVSYLMQIDFKSNLPAMFQTATVRRWVSRLGDLQTFLWERRLSHGRFLPEYKLIPKDARSRCFLCQRRFGSFFTKESCRKCGQVVCKSCSREWQVTTKSSLRLMRICFACTKRKVTKPPSYETTFRTLDVVSTRSKHNVSNNMVESTTQLSPPRRRGLSLPPHTIAVQTKEKMATHVDEQLIGLVRVSSWSEDVARARWR